ncbi:SCO family protein [Pseudodesulfovibrio sediminis]|uniref:Protein SCO1/2 n=1 Tax=Pseudodesulfovibrio sediminis TaxID=2810563 RepID=A0ABN6EWV2_9BACT|nr:SCO family protein [Pseudodesulfovibrio sediminis]BCS89720.1 hypothetical protein PSDVSF_29620 [Pseudodesulfovibrio sediminis]
MRSLFLILLAMTILAAPVWAASDGEPMDMAAQPAMDHSEHDSMAAQPAMDHSEHDSMDAMDGMGAADHDHEKMMEEAEKADLPVGIDEKLGNMLPDVEFMDSTGKRVSLHELIDIPVILLPIYYRCPDVCNLLQGSMASILPDVKLQPGKEIRIVSLSFDPREKPKDAARAKRNYLALANGYPSDQWLFLTGDMHAIDAVLDSIGYTVQKQGGLWAHPVAAIAIAPGGKVVRYLYGTTFLPFDITMAGTEAAEGKVGLSIKRLLSYCYNYDPDGRRYVFDILRVSGFSILGFVVIFLAWLIFGGKKKRR